MKKEVKRKNYISFFSWLFCHNFDRFLLISRDGILLLKTGWESKLEKLFITSSKINKWKCRPTEIQLKEVILTNFVKIGYEMAFSKSLHPYNIKSKPYYSLDNFLSKTCDSILERISNFFVAELLAYPVMNRCL